MPGETLTAATWKWGAVLLALGLGESFLTGKHGPCPFCGGKDRWRWDNKEGRGTWICNNCGAGDGIELVRRFLGIEFRDAIRRVDTVLGRPLTEDRKTERGDPRPRLRRIAQETRPATQDDAVGQYLRTRGLLVASEALRLHPALVYWDQRNGKPVKRGAYPAMVARVDDVKGEAITYHVTYLGPKGKAQVPSPKKILPGLRGISGGAIRLFEHQGRLAVAEGIETALAVHELTQIPAWATMNAGCMESLEVPAGVRELLVCADNDANYRGPKAAYTLANRMAMQGCAVRVRVAEQGDFLDDLKARRG